MNREESLYPQEENAHKKEPSDSNSPVALITVHCPRVYTFLSSDYEVKLTISLDCTFLTFYKTEWKNSYVLGGLYLAFLNYKQITVKK